MAEGWEILSATTALVTCRGNSQNPHILRFIGKVKGRLHVYIP